MFCGNLGEVCTIQLRLSLHAAPEAMRIYMKAAAISRYGSWNRDVTIRWSETWTDRRLPGSIALHIGTTPLRLYRSHVAAIRATRAMAACVQVRIKFRRNLDRFAAATSSLSDSYSSGPVSLTCHPSTDSSRRLRKHDRSSSSYSKHVELMFASYVEA